MFSIMRRSAVCALPGVAIVQPLLAIRSLWFPARLAAGSALMLLAASGQLVAQQAVSPDTMVLSLAEVHRLALDQNPAFQAARQDIAMAQGRLRQARVLASNPELTVEPEFGAPPGGGTEAWRASLSQAIEWAGQRGVRAAAARQDVNRAVLDVRDTARLRMAESSVAFFGALRAAMQLTVAEQLLALSERLRAATRVQLAEGEISVLDANLVEIERGRARARVLAARRHASSAEQELKRLLALPANVPVRLVIDTVVPAEPFPLDSLVRLALSRRTDLAARSAEHEEARLLGRLAAREALPSLRVALFAERDRVGGSTMLGLGFALPLPLWNRNGGLVAERQARLRQIGLRRASLERQVELEVVGAFRAYQAAREEAAIFSADVVVPARANLVMLDSAYLAGKVGLATLVLLRNQLLDAELGYWDAWYEQRRAYTRLDEVTAALVPVQSSNTDRGVMPWETIR